MKLFTLTATAATAAMMLSLGINSAEAHPRLWPHSHATRVVVEKQVVVKPAPVRTAVARALVGATFDTIPANRVRVVHAGRTYFVHDGVYHVRNGGPVYGGKTSCRSQNHDLAERVFHGTHKWAHPLPV